MPSRKFWHRWLQLRHAVVHDAVAQEKLAAAFDQIRAAFRPQQVDYSNTAYGKDHWNLSCFMEYTNGVAAKKVDLEAGEPMRFQQLWNGVDGANSHFIRFAPGHSHAAVGAEWV